MRWLWSLMCSMPGNLHLPTGDLLLSPTAAQGTSLELLSVSANIHTSCPRWGDEGQSPFVA